MTRAARATTVGLGTGPHLTRYAMYRRLSETVSPLVPTGSVRALSISGSEALLTAVAGDIRVEDAAYPEHDVRDLRAFADDSFDMVISDQVLEHVAGNPQDAIDASLRVLRPGGVAVHTTCFINPIHHYPEDFWRFTPDALRWLLRDSEVIEAAGWGNRWAAAFMDIGLRWVPIPHARWHPLHWLATQNDPMVPIVTWVVARKR